MITEDDEAAYWRWLTAPNMKLVEAFALYRVEIEKRFLEKDNNEVRN